jgi:mRNA interferase MazF
MRSDRPGSASSGDGSLSLWDEGHIGSPRRDGDWGDCPVTYRIARNRPFIPCPYPGVTRVALSNDLSRRALPKDANGSASAPREGPGEGKPGFYVVVSRSFIAENEDVSTVVCAPVYSQVLGLSTEVVIGPEEGLPGVSSVRCDFLALMFKRKLTTFVASLPPRKLEELNHALAVALDLA